MRIRAAENSRPEQQNSLIRCSMFCVFPYLANSKAIQIMKTRLFIILMISTILAACSKSDTTDKTALTNMPLKKYILLDPGMSAPNDTLIVSVYAYDNLNRCTSITSNDYAAGETIITQNFYTGSGTAIQSRKIDYGAGEFDWEYYTYNSAGQIIIDSIVTNIGNRSVYKYTVLSGNKFDMLMYNPTSGIPVLKASYLQTKDGANNIVAEKDSSFFYSSFLGNYDFRSESIISISYDGHPNPFYLVYPKRLIDLEYENAALDDFYQYYSIPQTNNILEEQRSVNPSATGLQTYHNRYTYQYNADGYPASVNISDLETGDVTKGIYIY